MGPLPHALSWKYERDAAYHISYHICVLHVRVHTAMAGLPGHSAPPTGPLPAGTRCPTRAHADFLRCSAGTPVSASKPCTLAGCVLAISFRRMGNRCAHPDRAASDLTRAVHGEREGKGALHDSGPGRPLVYSVQ